MVLTKEQAEAVRTQLLAQIEKLPKEQVGNLANQVKQATPEQLEAFIQQAQKQQGGGECIFCQIIDGKIDTVKIYEDNDILAVLDIMPANDGQLLVFPKQHFQFIQEIPDQLYQKLVILVETLKAQSLSIYIPQGQLAGQRIPHFVINLIPRFQGDKVSMDWERNKKDKKELEKVGKRLREEAQKKIIFEIEKEVKKEIAKKKEKVKEEAKKIMKYKKRRFP